MNCFVRVIMENTSKSQALSESITFEHDIYESEHDLLIFEMSLPSYPTHTQSNKIAKRLSDYLFEQGFDDFDIEISSDSGENIDEETYDGDDFHETYGVMWYNQEDLLDEAEYRGKKVKLGKPVRSQGGPKKFHVYVKKPTGNVVKVNFGDPNMKIKKSNPARRRSFRARHNCANPGPRWKARYWACRSW